MGRIDVIVARVEVKMMHSEIESIIHRIPGWKDAGELQIEPLAGLTNTNVRVTADGERFVLRVSGENAQRLGIKREHELEALTTASQAGIGAHVEHFLFPEGHLVTRYIQGRHMTLEEYRDEKNLHRIVRTLKRLHALPPVRAVFSSFRRVEAYAEQAAAAGVPFPSDFEALLARMALIEQEQARDSTPWHKFCHNDLFCGNVLDDGKIRFIDWEFSGTGDLYYDLATLTYAYDSLDTLPGSLQRYLLECYFGDVHAVHWRRLKGMQYMVMFFAAMWGLLQQALHNQGLVREIEGFNFLDYANATFEAMRAQAS